jgi:predicted permease
MRDPDDDIREEIDDHLARRAEANQAQGMDPAQAASAARRRFGNSTLVQEQARRTLVPAWIDDAARDLAFAARTFSRSPGFTAAAVAALAIGIGSATAVFSVVDRVLFRPLPYADANQLVSVGMAAPMEPDDWLLGPDYLEWRDRQTAFQALTYVSGIRPCDITHGETTRLRCGFAQASFLDVFGVRPIEGRNFTHDDDQPASPPTALLTHAYWQSRFGRAPVVGRMLAIDGQQARILGVLPPDFEFPGLQDIDLLVPNRMDEAAERLRRPMSFVHAYGRLKPGVTIQQARDSLQPLFQDSQKQVPPAFRKEVALRVVGFRERQVRDYKAAYLLLMGAVLLVLLVACANVANLVLARMAAREREMSVRAAIGAGRGRLARQIAVENLGLGALAGVLGVAVATLLLRLFRSIAPDGIPKLADASLDIRVLLFAVAACVASGLLAGVVPALRVRARPVAPSADWLRQALCAAQVALSLILLSGAGLLARSLWMIQNADLGFNTDHVLTARVELPRTAYQAPDRQRSFFLELEQRLARLPGVESVALSDSLPPTERRVTIFSLIQQEGHAVDRKAATGGLVVLRTVTPAYFATLGVPVVDGQGFAESDRAGQEGLVVIDGRLARRLYGDESPVGRRIRPGGEGEWYRIVGVARAASNAGIVQEGDPEYYVLMRNSTWRSRGLAVSMRLARDPRPVIPLVRAELASMDRGIAAEVELLERRIDRLAARPRFNAAVLSLFGVFAVVLAAVGLAGVVSYLVARRTREIGVRMALGATRGSILAMVVRQSMAWTLLGAGVGLVGGLASSRWIKAMLYRVEPHDPGTLAAVTVALLVVGLVAAWVPARRASRLDPLVALRQE